MIHSYISIILFIVISNPWTGEGVHHPRKLNILPGENQLVDISMLDSSIILDLRYATQDNFVATELYDCAKCFLHKSVAVQLIKVQETLRTSGHGVKLFDCYRPHSVQERLWEIMPNASYVTHPSKGSMHNRGLAVDLTLVNQNGEELDMGTPFDFFGRKAHHDHSNLPSHILGHRKWLKSIMEEHGFRSIRTEWWHYSLPVKGQSIQNWKWACDEQ